MNVFIWNGLTYHVRLIEVFRVINIKNQKGMKT
jgi:hypothetical protein